MRKLTLLFAALTLSAGLWAIDGVKYIDANGEEQTADNVTVITHTTTLTGGWYLTYEAYTGTLVCTGAVHLILADGVKLTATGDENQPGIKVSGEGNSLTIYGQANQSGQLEATGGNYAAGIGGGNRQDGSNITINGGTVTATGGQDAAGIGGGGHGSGSYITINGGIVTATGGALGSVDLGGAGIGGGQGGYGSHITINGGTVTAKGGTDSSGIGGGNQGSGSYITINGGIVIATGHMTAAGIGGGSEVDGSNITINGGTVTAKGGNFGGAGIGGGEFGSGSNITINGGTVTANGGDLGGAGIGGGIQGSASITINGGEVTATGGEFGGDGIGSGSEGSGSNIFVATTHIVKAGDEVIAPTRTDGTDLASELAGKRYVTIELDLAPIKAAAIDEIDAAVVGIADETILAVATKAKTDIGNATSVKEIDAIKTLALAKINAIKEINAATAGMILFPAEESYIDFIKSSIQQDDDVNLINGDKQLGLDYIALHDAKLAAVAAVKHDMGDYAESEAIYNFIGGPAIEGAVDADKITEAKIAALAKLEEFSQVLGAANIAGYNKGKEDGIEEVLGEMAEPCEDCNAVEITDGEITITLYSPKQVKFIKTQAEEE